MKLLYFKDACHFDYLINPDDISCIYKESGSGIHILVKNTVIILPFSYTVASIHKAMIEVEDGQTYRVSDNMNPVDCIDYFNLLEMEEYL